ncbi:DoxX subfamily protein [Mycobacterium alsense]|uniref:DoxX family membrane protein n=1 Tax=Mycobacterium alsense TaxID=324058 RepID=A0AA41XTZ3_9MYCO|nr:DoxX family protein [Mycobacterium alsense]MCV7381212.1 DoxX family membrane protein [Mycobacterium alsense]OQZ91038.1 DoxX subfamily protein [Mycobacterium alsense]
MLFRRIARPLLSAVFVGQGIDSLRNPKPAAEAAAPTVDGLRALPDPVGSRIPSDPQTFAQITAAVQIGGGLLLATGKAPRAASAALALTVLPANLGAHMFWSERDPQLKAQKRKDFLTDLSLLGGLMIASADTAGRPSLGWRGRRAAERLSERVSSALPGSAESHAFDADFGELGEKIARGLHVGAERGRELAGTAAEKGAPYAGAALERGRELASTAAERGAPYAEAALERARELAETAAERGAPLAKRARKRGEELAGTAAERGAPLAKKARKRGEELADVARDRGVELAEIARLRGSQFASEAAARGSQLADAARERVEDGVKPSRRRRPW